MRILELLESFDQYKNIKLKENPFNRHDILNVIETFKQAVSKGFLTGPERSITYWMKRPLDELSNRLVRFTNYYSAKDKKKMIKRAGTISVGVYGNYKVIIPLTPEAAKIYGSSTKWCVSSEGERGDYYFYSYQNPESTLIFLIPDNQQDEKIAIQYGKMFDIVYDEMDKSNDDPTHINKILQDSGAGVTLKQIKADVAPHIDAKNKQILQQIRNNATIIGNFAAKGLISVEDYKEDLFKTARGLFVYMEASKSPDKEALKRAFDTIDMTTVNDYIRGRIERMRTELGI